MSLISRNLKRKLIDYLFTVFCWLVTLIVGFIFLSIVYSLLHLGLPRFDWTSFVTPLSPSGETGGIANAILGSLLINGCAIVLASVIGILIATYLVEFVSLTRTGKIIRLANDVLLSTPSIIVGLFVYALMVKPMGHYSGLAGITALFMIAMVMVSRGTEDVLYLVSPLLRESALSLGIPRWRFTLSIAYRLVQPGIVTSILLALARIMGETAPLLFTSLNNQYSSWDLRQPMASLPMVIYQYALSPYADWQQLAWSAALLITILILGLNVFLRFFFKKKYAVNV